MNLAFYPVECAYRIIRDRPVIELYGRTTEHKQICVQVEGFEPYFYVHAEEDKLNKVKEEIEKLEIKTRDRTVRPAHVEMVTRKIKISDESLLKVYAGLPQDVEYLRSAIQSIKGVTSLYDADIPFVRRFLIDSQIIPLMRCMAEGEAVEARARVPVIRAKEVKPENSETYENLRILAFDIETLITETDEISTAETPIVMLGLYSEHFRRVIVAREFQTKLDYVECVKSEKELLLKFREYMEKLQPDVLVGYYSDGFDLPYILARAKKLDVPVEIGMDLSGIRMQAGRERVARITGICHLDIFKFIRKTMATVLETSDYTLKAVSQEILNETKEEIDLNQLNDAWEKHPHKLDPFCSYNMQDVSLTFKLCRKLLPNLIELVKTVGLPLSDISRMAYSQLVEWYLVKEAKEMERVAPLSPHSDEIRERIKMTYQGAFVYQPTPGLQKEIVVFDFRSLYPSIISAHNISPETLGCRCCVNEEHVPNEQNLWFCRKNKGFVSHVIEGLINRRGRVKELMKSAKPSDSIILNARQQALKTIANAMYGYLGFFGARWYSIEAAKSITSYGRFYIQNVIEEAKKSGFNVLYGDTDSIFLSLVGKSKKDAESFLDRINKKLPGMMELELEGYYPTGIFVSMKAAEMGAKKKYALLAENGTIKIRGFESVKRNYAPIAKEVQEGVLGIVLREQDIEKAFSFVREIVDELRRKKTDVRRLVIETKLQKSVRDYENRGPHVAAAERMKEQGIPVGPGTLIRYIVTEGGQRIRDRVKLPNEVREGEYDSEYYVEHQVLPVVEKIFEVLGYSRDDLVESKAQSKLQKFM